jgi:hypothetical protein
MNARTHKHNLRTHARTRTHKHAAHTRTHARPPHAPVKLPGYMSTDTTARRAACACAAPKEHTTAPDVVRSANRPTSGDTSVESAAAAAAPPPPPADAPDAGAGRGALTALRSATLLLTRPPPPPQSPHHTTRTTHKSAQAYHAQNTHACMHAHGHTHTHTSTHKHTHLKCDGVPATAARLGGTAGVAPVIAAALRFTAVPVLKVRAHSKPPNARP